MPMKMREVRRVTLNFPIFLSMLLITTSLFCCLLQEINCFVPSPVSTSTPSSTYTSTFLNNVNDNKGRLVKLHDVSSFVTDPTSLVSFSDNVAHAASSNSNILFPSTSLMVNLLFKKTTSDAARGTFWFCLGAGSGAGGIGLRQIPKLLEEIADIKQLASTGVRSEGESLNVGPITSLWYPEPLSKRDIEKVLKESPGKATTITDGSTSTAYLATVGYMEREDYMNYVTKKRGCHPLATYAVFDALSGGKGGFVSPVEYEFNLVQWKSNEGIEMIQKALDKAILVKLSSFGALAFLLFLIFDLIVENFYYGWLS